MPRPKRQLLATAEATLTPPASLEPSHAIARVVKADGNNLYTVTLPSGQNLLVELPAQFRSKIWIRRGGFVVVNSDAFEDRDNKLGGEIVNVVGDQKAWMKMPFWPKEFSKQALKADDSEDDSTAGKMPPSDDDED